MGSKSAPRAPDYRGAAEEQAASSQKVTTQQSYANRPTQTTPWGTSSWTTGTAVDPATGQNVTTWNQDLTLSPTEQAAFDSQSRVRQGLSEGAETLLGDATAGFENKIDYNALPEWGATPQHEYDASGVTERGTAPTVYDSGVTSDKAWGTGPTLSDEAVTSSLLRGTVPTAPTSAVSSDRAWGDAPTVSGSALEGVRDFATGPTVGGPVTTQNQMAGIVDADVSNELSRQQVNAGGAFNQDFATTQYDRQMSLENPQMERQRAALETQLRNQGLAPGSEAYDNAMGDLDDQQGEIRSRMAQDAMRLGAEEQQRQFGREIATRQQGGVEAMDEFGRNLGSAVQQNAQQYQEFQQSQQNEAQRFDQELQAAGFSDQQRAQMVQQRLADQEQQFMQQLQRGQYMDAQREMDFSQALRGQDQLFSQQATASDMMDAQRAADYDEQLAGREQQFSQQLQAGEYADTQRAADYDQQLASREQQFSQELDAGEFMDAQRRASIDEQLDWGAQNFDQQMQGANYQTRLRQAQLAEQQGARSQSLNELNALMYGNQISQPTMPTFSDASRAESTQYGTAAANQGQFANQRYSTALSPLNSLIGAAGQYAGGLDNAYRIYGT